MKPNLTIPKVKKVVCSISLTDIKMFFLVYEVSGSGQSVLIWTDPEQRESKETVLCPLGWK
jgi:hypothetical protein